MKIEIDAKSSDEYGDYGTIRVYFEEGAWLEIDAADFHNLDWDKPSHGATLTAHHADGSEEVVWDGPVLTALDVKKRQRQAS